MEILELLYLFIRCENKCTPLQTRTLMNFFAEVLQTGFSPDFAIRHQLLYGLVIYMLYFLLLVHCGERNRDFGSQPLEIGHLFALSQNSTFGDRPRLSLIVP